MRVIVVEEGTRSDLSLDRPVVRIGRAIDNEIRLAGKLISRHHCQIEQSVSGVELVDLGSANGSQLNGKKVERARMSTGDEIQLGSARIQVFLDEPSAVPDADEALSGVGAVGLSTLTGGAAQERQSLHVYSSIVRALLSETDLAALLRLIVDSAIELAGAERGFLLLRDPPGAREALMAVRVARNFDQSEVHSPGSRLSTGIARSVSESGRPVLSVDAGRDERFSGMASVEDLRLRSVLCLPIILDGKTEGVLYLDNRLQQGAFSEEDLDLMALFAAQAALALRNSTQLHELRLHNKKLSESRVHIERLNEQLGRKVRDREAELAVVRAELGHERGRYDYQGIVGASDAMKRVFAELDRIVESELPVLIQGESGTGKELIARAIHYNGPRKAKPFVSESCAALPDSLLESELFGHTRGAFTGADRAKKGLVEQAAGGTLFLDEIGDMSVEMQKKLLRLLQEGELRPLGSNVSVKVDFRLVAASHRDLALLVKQGQFREDLYYRIKVLSIDLPPLRERVDDIPLLAEALLARAARDAHKPVPMLTAETRAALRAHPWPGNVRELENEMRRLVALGEEMVTPEHLSSGMRTRPALVESGGPVLAPGTSLRAAVASFERDAIVAALEAAGGNKSRAASELGISRFALQRKLGKYGLAESAGEGGDDVEETLPRSEEDEQELSEA